MAENQRCRHRLDYQISEFGPEKDAAYENIKLNIKTTLIEAATEFKLKKIRYVAQIGNKQYIAKSIMKEGNEYKQFRRDLYPAK